MSADRNPGIPGMDFTQYTGEPNRRSDLEAFGLVRPGHVDERTAVINIGGQSREIRVRPITMISGEQGPVTTILKPVKADFRQAVREMTGQK